MTIGEAIKGSMLRLLCDRKCESHRAAAIKWMRGNPVWCKELIAKEWQEQTGEDWEDLMFDSYHEPGPW